LRCAIRSFPLLAAKLAPRPPSGAPNGYWPSHGGDGRVQGQGRRGAPPIRRLRHGPRAHNAERKNN
jgi:hypothetical protein